MLLLLLPTKLTNLISFASSFEINTTIIDVEIELLLEYRKLDIFW